MAAALLPPQPQNSAVSNWAPGYWECEADAGWLPYDWLIAAQIEAEWRKGSGEVFFSDRGHSYIIRFARDSATPECQVMAQAQGNLNTQKRRGVRRWTSLQDKAEIGVRQQLASATLWGKWISCPWAWPLSCSSGPAGAPAVPLGALVGIFGVGGGCGCQAPAQPFAAEVPQVSYSVFGEGVRPESLPFPLCSWPATATLCIHPAGPSRRANFALERVEPGGAEGQSPEHEWVRAQWNASGLAPSHEFLGTLRVMNRGLLTGFAGQRAAMQTKLADREDFTDGQDRSAALQVLWLWHGTRCSDKVFDVCREGFDRAHAKVCVFGKGCYFASDAKIAESYACHCHSFGGTRCMRVLVLSAVLCGEVARGSRDEYPAPAKPHSRNGERYENMVNNESQPTIFVTSKDNQAVPVYIVAYRRN